MPRQDFHWALLIPTSHLCVRDNPALSRFELDAKGVTAVSYYTLAGGVMTFTHTEVGAYLGKHPEFNDLLV